MAGEYDAALAASGQLLTSAMSSLSAADANKDQRDWQTQQSDIQYQRQKEMWNMTNEFNLKVSDPAFQMQRLKAAGLNPWLAQGKPQEVNANSPNVPLQGNYNHQRADYSFGQAMMNYLAAKMMNKQMQVADADVSQKMAQANLTDAQADNVRQLTPLQVEGSTLDNVNKGLQSSQLKSATSKLDAEITAIGKQNNLTDAQVENVKQMTAKTLKEIDNLVSQGKLNEAMIKEKRLTIQILEATAKSKIEAENAKNQLIKETGGLGGPGGLVGAGVGSFIEQMKKLLGNDYQTRPYLLP